MLGSINILKKHFVFDPGSKWTLIIYLTHVS
jgi:hypothetical protein